jgi:hypothetical protein
MAHDFPRVIFVHVDLSGPKDERGWRAADREDSSTGDVDDIRSDRNDGHVLECGRGAHHWRQRSEISFHAVHFHAVQPFVELWGRAGIIAMRSVRCSSWSLRISVCARKARFMGVFGSSELNKTALSFTYLVSAALVRKVRPRDRAGVISRALSERQLRCVRIADVARISDYVGLVRLEPYSPALS